MSIFDDAAGRVDGPPRTIIGYEMRVSVGTFYVAMRISSQLMYESRQDNLPIAPLLIEQLAYKLHMQGLALASPSKVTWVMLTGVKGYEGVVGYGFRDIRRSDFHVLSKDSDVAVMKGMLVPASTIPDKCDRPACGKWATNEYGIIDTPEGLGHHMWGRMWFAGDTIHTCPPHAQELLKEIRQSEYLTFKLNP